MASARSRSIIPSWTRRSRIDAGTSAFHSSLSSEISCRTRVPDVAADIKIRDFVAPKGEQLGNLGIPTVYQVERWAETDHAGDPEGGYGIGRDGHNADIGKICQATMIRNKDVSFAASERVGAGVANVCVADGDDDMLEGGR